MFISIIAYLLFSATHVLSNTCSWATSCRCGYYSYSKRYYIKCIGGENINLSRFALHNYPTTIDIRDVKFENMSSFESLRSSNVTMINFRTIEVDGSWDLNWLPEHIEKLSLTNIISGMEKITSYNQRCDQPRIKKLDYISWTNQKFGNMITCIPGSINKMILHNITFDRTPGKDIQFPPQIELVTMNYCSFSVPLGKLFDSGGHNLRLFNIKFQNFSDGKMPIGLRAKNLKHLQFIANNISEIPPEALAPLREIGILKYFTVKHNRLRRIPRGLPLNLYDLSVQNNVIDDIDPEVWIGLTNLTQIDLSNNKLLLCPIGLPSTLQRIIITGNVLEYCPSEAFANMPYLTDLDLSNNRLTIMPNGISPSISGRYNLVGNRIAFVRGPADYEFCSNCKTFSLSNNPWVCNSKLLNMIVWLADRKETLQLIDDFSVLKHSDKSFYCKSPGDNGFDNDDLQNVISFNEIYKKLPPYDKCVYSVESFKCDNVGLSEPQNILPPNLIEIEIKNNYNLREIPDYYLYNKSRLLYILLNNNSLTTIPYGLPTQLRTLNLRDNQIEFIGSRDRTPFKNLTKLKYLYLEGNKIQTFTQSEVSFLRNLLWFGISHNPLNCDCEILTGYYWYSTFKGDHPSIHPNLPLHTSGSIPRCVAPSSVNGRNFLFLSGHFTYRLNCVPRMCEFNPKYPTLNCSIFVQNNTLLDPRQLTPTFGKSSYWKELDLSGLQLQSNQISLMELSGLKTLNLSNNDLSEFPTRIPASITHLNLSNNSIQDIPDNLHLFLPELRVLDLRSNNIRTISAPTVSHLQTFHLVDIKNNSLQCNCSIIPLHTWAKSYQENENDLSTLYLQDVACTNKDGQDILLKDIVESHVCTVLSLAVILPCTFAGVVVISLLAAAVNIYLYKTRKSKKKNHIIQGFQKLLEKNDPSTTDPETGQIDSAFTYDAFVSYSAAEKDLEFAISLAEKLEDKLGFTLCLHERDFTPGVGITDNIANCIGSSRHVVLILSKDFIESNWCQYEVQVALVELHRRRRDKLLIAVTLGDVFNEIKLDGHLRTFLDLITCVSAPISCDGDNPEWIEFEKRISDYLTL